MKDNDSLKYIKNILVVSKEYGLPKWYNPGLDDEAILAFNEMKCCAEKYGFNLAIVSGFRSYEYQEKIYNEYIKEYGEEVTDTFSAQPGHSEHQTGLALDIGRDEDSYQYTEESIWLANNSYKFGYIIRYPKGKEKITGYKYEPWHIRYVGKEHAKLMYKNNLTLEEYLGLC